MTSSLTGAADRPALSDDGVLPEAPRQGTLYERRYKMLMSAIPCSVLLVDPHLRIVAVNENFLRKARRPEAHTVGERLGKVLPPGIVEQMEMERRVRQVFDTGEPIRGERMTYRAPGVPLRIYYYSVIPVIWDGAVAEVMFLMDDVTEQIRLSEEIRQVERHLASVVEAASDLIVSTDPEGRVVTWNAAAEELTGYRLSEVRNRPFAELCVAEDQAEVERAFVDVDELEHLPEPEWRLESKKHQGVAVSWVFSLMRNEAGKVVGAVAIGRDLTERRKLEAQILQSQKLAALGVMAGGIAHEVRNPLAVCASAAQFLMEDEPTPEFVNECAQKIQSGVQRASFIIENLLRFSRPSATKHMESIDLAAVVRNALGLVANEARLKKIRVVKRIPRTPVQVNGNGNMVEQVLMNLVFNAFGGMPRSGTLKVTLKTTGSEAVMSIGDTGCGIAEKDMDKIFDPFYTTRPVGEGTGLGLSLCYSIVKHHSGTIEVKSTKGKGTTCTVRLPLLRRGRITDGGQQQRHSDR